MQTWLLSWASTALQLQFVSWAWHLRRPAVFIWLPSQLYAVGSQGLHAGSLIPWHTPEGLLGTVGQDSMTFSISHVSCLQNRYPVGLRCHVLVAVCDGGLDPWSIASSVSSCVLILRKRVPLLLKRRASAPGFNDASLFNNYRYFVIRSRLVETTNLGTQLYTSATFSFWSL